MELGDIKPQIDDEQPVLWDELLCDHCGKPATIMATFYHHTYLYCNEHVDLKG